jgi:hypothetical protein
LYEPMKKKIAHNFYKPMNPNKFVMCSLYVNDQGFGIILALFVRFCNCEM